MCFFPFRELDDGKKLVSGDRKVNTGHVHGDSMTTNPDPISKKLHGNESRAFLIETPWQPILNRFYGNCMATILDFTSISCQPLSYKFNGKSMATNHAPISWKLHGNDAKSPWQRRCNRLTARNVLFSRLIVPLSLVIGRV